MYSICLRYLNDKDQANDAFQDGFFAVYKNIEQLKKPEALPGWIKRIFVNACVQSLKKNKNLENTTNIEESASHKASLDGNAIEALSVEEIKGQIAKLPSGARTVFNLYAIEGYSHKEIAEMLNISLGTSKSQLHDARKLLKQRISNSQKTINELDEQRFTG
ncbi:MAG: sigma-70 family RNA polymerase sigma factor [Flavobacteriales bacterium]|nr:sigma-70 family RNA polymerase sigma factor [Flavobacteriales bacterium]